MTGTARAKLLLVGLDAAEPTLVRRLASEGRMPHLARLMGEGASSDLRSAAVEFPDEVWPSIYSSVNAAELGKYYYIQPRPSSLRLELVEDLPRREQFWHVLSRAGRTCAVVDAPKTGLGAAVNGLQICNWGAHATRCDRTAHPPGLMDEVLRVAGEYPLHSCDDHGRSPRDYHRLRAALVAGVRARGRLLHHLLAGRDWDLFFAVFSETHCAGHQFWHLQDPHHPQYDPADRHGLRSALADVYQAADDELGALVDAAGPWANVMVFSGHGMAPQYHGRDLVPALLDLWGLSGARRKSPGGERRIRMRPGAVRLLKQRVPMGLQYAVKRLLPRALEQAIVCRVMGSKALDPRARVNPVPNNDLNPAFRVNLKGRDPAGLVDPGAEYEAVLSFLEARLRELENGATGRPAIRHISRISETHRGRHLSSLPDLCAMWSAEAWIGELYSPGYGWVAWDHRDLRTGGHDATGFVALRAPGFVAEFESRAPTALDVAPTVLTLLDTPAPDWMEGRSLASPSRTQARAAVLQPSGAAG